VFEPVEPAAELSVAVVAAAFPLSWQYITTASCTACSCAVAEDAHRDCLAY
jgi:hypothetical protein